jgi:uroporphyrinogen-III synthase
VRLGVTTTADRAEPFVTAFTALGIESVSLPCTRVDVADRGVQVRAAAACEDADLMMLSSPRPVEILWKAGFPPTPAAVTGVGTAELVQERGGIIETSVVGGALELAKLIAPRLKGRQAAYPHAHGGDPRVVLTLADAARSLTAVAVYQLDPEPPGRDLVDVVLFDHPCAVEGWLLTRRLAEVKVVTVGQATAGAVVRSGRKPDLALRPTKPSMLARAIAERFSAGVPAAVRKP